MVKTYDFQTACYLFFDKKEADVLIEKKEIFNLIYTNYLYFISHGKKVLPEKLTLIEYYLIFTIALAMTNSTILLKSYDYNIFYKNNYLSLKKGNTKIYLWNDFIINIEKRYLTVKLLKSNGFESEFDIENSFEIEMLEQLFMCFREGTSIHDFLFLSNFEMENYMLGKKLQFLQHNIALINQNKQKKLLEIVESLKSPLLQVVKSLQN